MADREARLAHLNQKLDYLRSQSTAQTRLLFHTTDQCTRQAIQENHSNLLLEIQHVKAQLRQLKSQSTTALIHTIDIFTVKVSIFCILFVCKSVGR